MLLLTYLLQPSGGASVDEYKCVQNESSCETTNCIVYYGCATSLLLNSLARRRTKSTAHITAADWKRQSGACALCAIIVVLCVNFRNWPRGTFV